MQKQKSLTVNFIMNAILTMSSFVFPLITFPYVSRILQPAGTGKVSFVASIVSYFAMFAQLGIPTYGIRACARVRDDREELSRTVHELFFINLVMSALAYGALFIAVVNVPRLRQEKELLLVTSLTIILNAVGMEWLYKALEKYTYITVRSIIFKLIAFIAVFFLVKEQKDYIWYGIVSIFATSASNVFNLIHVHKLVMMRPLKGYNFSRHIKSIAVFFAMSCAATIYTNLDTVMLGFMKTDIDVGYYNAAVKVKTILLSVVTSLGTVLLPRVSYYLENGYMNEFRRIASKAVNFVFLMALPLCVYFVLFAEESIHFLSGKAYSGAIEPMQMIMPTLIFIGLTNIMGIQILVPMGKEVKVLYSEMAGAAVDLLLNILLIPDYGAAGAAFGTLAAEIAVWIVQFCFLKKEIKEFYRKIRYIHLAEAAFSGLLVSFWVKWMDWNEFVVLAVSACLFFGTYLLFLYFAKESIVLEMKRKIFPFR